MTSWLTSAMLGGSAVLAAVAAWFTARNRPVNVWVLGVAALLELLFLVQLVVGVVALATQHQHVNAALFLAYLLGLVVVVPVAVAWALAERTRWGMGVLVVAGLSLLVLVARLQQLWGGQGA
ncbi:MAG TPA: hypothetical protein VFJ97_16615 [Dermatophilaceae bacterium]|nr:hypothetical protein [Dermatophilaceae bacterium]